MAEHSASDLSRAEFWLSA